MTFDPRQRPSFYDIQYAIASAAVTNGVTIISTTVAAYHGFSLISTSAGATLRLYDSISAATGNILELAQVGANVSTRHDNFIPIQAKIGIVVSLTLATGAQGVVFYSPKG